MKITCKNEHKNTKRSKTVLIVMGIVGFIALLTFVGSFIDYLLKLKVMTYVCFAAAFLAAFIVFKKLIVEYVYELEDGVFSVDRVIDEAKKTIFAVDVRYIDEVLTYEEFSSLTGISCYYASFAKKPQLTYIVYTSEEKKKAIAVYASREFAAALKESLKKGREDDE